jgi:hypothetical protein
LTKSKLEELFKKAEKRRKRTSGASMNALSEEVPRSKKKPPQK